MGELGAKNGFECHISQAAEKVITPENLKNTDVIIFYTTGELPLSDEKKAAFLDFVKSGKGLHRDPQRDRHLLQVARVRRDGRRLLQRHPWTQKTR